MIVKIPSTIRNEAGLACDFCHRQNVLGLSKNTMYCSCIKHINIRYHWLCQEIEQKLFKLEKIHIDENVVNMMTNSSWEIWAIC